MIKVHFIHSLNQLFMVTARWCHSLFFKILDWTHLSLELPFNIAIEDSKRLGHVSNIMWLLYRHLLNPFPSWMRILIQRFLLFLHDVVSGILLTFDFLPIAQDFLSSLLHLPVANCFLVSVLILLYLLLGFNFILFLGQIWILNA